MTAPTPDYLRALAVAPKRLGDGWRISAVAALHQSADALAAVTAERDQARQMLADAPHADDCTYLEEDVVEPYGTRISPNAHCTCWKAGL